jgi:hypothetical protein
MLFTEVTAVYSDIKQAINMFILLTACFFACFHRLLFDTARGIITFLRKVGTLLPDNMASQLFIITSDIASDLVSIFLLKYSQFALISYFST